MKKSIKIIHWTPRFLCILAILFISIFSLDAFGHGKPFWNQIGDFLMHLIPSFILAGILLLAWKKEIIGGVIFILIGAIATPWVYSHNFAMNQSVGQTIGIVMTLTAPFVLVGVLFIIGHYMKKKEQKTKGSIT